MAGSPLFSVNFTKIEKFQPILTITCRDPDQTSRFCEISISYFCWSRVFGCSLLFSVQSVAWQATFDVMPSWPFIRPLWKTGGKSLHALVGSAASGGEINFNIILSTLWWDEKAFLYKVIFKFVLMYRNNIEFYPFFAIEWTAEWTDKNSHWCISSTILHLSAQKMDSKLQVSFWWHQLPSGPITSWL